MASDVSRVHYDPDWLSIREVARRLSVGQRQVKKWIAAGQFHEIAVLGPRMTRISRAAYEQFVQKKNAA